jgi:hypothetical protein
MNRKLFCLAAIALLLGQSAWAGKPSRAAQKNCAWEKISDAALGLEAWVQRCDFGFRKIDLYAKTNALMMHYSDGGEPEPLIEVFDLAANETPEKGIKRIFAEHTKDKTLVARCALKPYKGDPAPAGVKRFTFLPNAALQKELDKTNDPGDIPEPPCGDWGDAPDGIQYFEAQPTSGAQRVMFVRAGQDEPLFDEKTLHLLPPTQ